MREEKIINLISKIEAIKEELIKGIDDIGELFLKDKYTFDGLFNNLIKGLLNYGASRIYIYDNKGMPLHSNIEKLSKIDPALLKSKGTTKLKATLQLDKNKKVAKMGLGCNSEYFCVISFENDPKNHVLVLIKLLIRHYSSLICFLSKHNDFACRLALRLLYNFDRDTYMHSYRVKLYSQELAKSLGFDNDQVKKIRLASMLHDFGKLFIPPHILKKPGKLDQDEFEIVKRHVTKGERFLRLMGMTDAEILNVVKYHHEKLDGSGYPEGRRDLSDICWVFQAADILDAIQTSRSYKESLGIKFLKDEFLRMRGYLPDKVIDATINFIGSDRFYVCRKRILKKQNSFKPSNSINDVFEFVNKLKNENAGLKREVALYKKIIDKEMKELESLREKMKLNRHNVEFVLLNSLEKLGKLTSVVIFSNGRVVSIYKDPVDLEVLRHCSEKARNLKTDGKDVYFEYLTTRNGFDICAIFEGKPKGVTPSLKALIEGLAF